MIISAFILMIICYVRVGGLQLIKELYPYALAESTLLNETSCGIPPEDYFSLIRPLNSANGPPWVGIIGMTILSIWYWCSDQVSMTKEKMNTIDFSYSGYRSTSISCEEFNSCSSWLYCC